MVSVIHIKPSRQGMKYSSSELDRIRELAGKDIPPLEIARILDRTEYRIKAICKQHDIKLANKTVKTEYASPDVNPRGYEAKMLKKIAPPTLMEQAEFALAGKLRFHKEANYMKLSGEWIVATLEMIIKEANHNLHADGCEQIGPVKWRVV